MERREVLHRIVEQRKRFVSRHRAYDWTSFSPDGDLRPIPGFAAAIRAGLSPALEAAVRASATLHLDGHFAAHGVAWPRRDPSDSFPEDLWRLDPCTGRAWPGREYFCFDAKYRDRADLGDIKFVWDFNRLQFLQPLAVAAALWDDDRALHMIEAVIAGWSQANPPFRGVAWNSGIELALRAVSVVIVQTLCGERLAPETRRQMGRLLRAHLYWLQRFPSRFSSANNHLIAEALGIFVIASVLPADADTRDAAAHARTILEAEAVLQILPDGVGAEQSPTYGAFTAEMLLFASFVARAFGTPLAGQVEERLLAFTTFVAWLADARGRVPNIGDDDGGRVLSRCAEGEHAYPASIGRAICAHFNQPFRIPRSDDAPELRHAIFNEADGTAAPPQDGLKSFQSGGYTVVRETRAGRRMRMVVDHGPLGYLAIAAHGHADANAFTLSLDDEDVLVDPGTYLYHSGGAWRSYFRGTRAHNTLSVGGADQSVIAGPFNWSRKAQGRLTRLERGDPWLIEASHNGYVDPFGIQHHRSFEATATGLAINDRISNPERNLDVEATLQFAPGLEVETAGVSATVRRDGRTVLSVVFSEPGHVATYSGGDTRSGGWVSPAFGHRLEAVRLVWAGKMPHCGLRTELHWDARGLNGVHAPLGLLVPQ